MKRTSFFAVMVVIALVIVIDPIIRENNVVAHESGSAGAAGAAYLIINKNMESDAKDEKDAVIKEKERDNLIVEHLYISAQREVKNEENQLKLMLKNACADSMVTVEEMGNITKQTEKISNIISSWNKRLGVTIKKNKLVAEIEGISRVYNSYYKNSATNYYNEKGGAVMNFFLTFLSKRSK